MWNVIDQNCRYSKNLYNYANYIIRQEFINNGKWIKYKEIDKMLQQTEPYKQLMSQPSQCTLQVLDRNWKSYFAAIKDWKEHKNKCLGMPRLPNYKKKDGRFTWFIKNNQALIENGYLCFIMRAFGGYKNGYKFKTNVTGRLISVRFVPHGDNYTLEIVYEKEVPEIAESFESKRIVSIDLGVNNFITMTNNIGYQPIIVNGKGIKSINQFYSKKRAEFQSQVERRNNQIWSNNLRVLDYKRNNRIKNIVHNSSRFVVNWCVKNGIDTLVCGYNEKWKQRINIGDNNNQKFQHMPYKMLVEQLTYKCQDAGIRFVTIDEAYTSGTDYLSGELPCKENYNKSRRINRGLFQSIDRLINSDVNGSLQIGRKAFPNAFVECYGIEGILTPETINVVRVT